MKKIIVSMLLVFALAACGTKKKDPNKTNTGIPGYDTTLPSGKLLNRLKNTSWEMPSFKEANISFQPEGTTVAMNKEFVMKNARLTVISDEKDLLVFTVDDLTNSVTFSLKMKDKDTVTVAPHTAGANISESHDRLAQEFKRIK